MSWGQISGPGGLGTAFDGRRRLDLWVRSSMMETRRNRPRLRRTLDRLVGEELIGQDGAASPYPGGRGEETAAFHGVDDASLIRRRRRRRD